MFIGLIFLWLWETVFFLLLHVLLCAGKDMHCLICFHKICIFAHSMSAILTLSLFLKWLPRSTNKKRRRRRLAEQSEGCSTTDDLWTLCQPLASDVVPTPTPKFSWSCICAWNEIGALRTCVCPEWVWHWGLFTAYWQCQSVEEKVQSTVNLLYFGGARFSVEQEILVLAWKRKFRYRKDMVLKSAWLRAMHVLAYPLVLWDHQSIDLCCVQHNAAFSPSLSQNFALCKICVIPSELEFNLFAKFSFTPMRANDSARISAETCSFTVVTSAPYSGCTRYRK